MRFRYNANKLKLNIRSDLQGFISLREPQPQKEGESCWLKADRRIRGQTFERGRRGVWSQKERIYVFINKSLCNQLSQNYQEHQRLMKPLRRTVRTARTREDYGLFRVSMPSFDPATVRQIVMMCQPGHYLKPEQPFASLFFHFSAIRALGLDSEKEQGGFGQQLSTHISGTVERFGSAFEKSGDAWAIKEGVQKGSLELLYLRECEHFLKKQSMDNGNNKVNFNLSPGKVCPRCGKEVWIYTSPEEEIVTTEDLLRANTALAPRDLLELQWTVIVNEQFTPTTVLAKAGESEVYLPILGKATYLLGEGEKPTPNGPIMRIRRVYCYHERILERRCQFCLQMIEQEQLQEFNRYLFQYSSKGVEHAFTKGTALQQQQQEYISGLLSRKKLILILDLDNTILHSTEMSQLQLAKVLKIRQYFIIPKLEFNSEGKLMRDYVMVKIRPYFREFLFVISKLFQVYVYTKGTRLYADEICKWIRFQWGGSDDLPFDFPTWTSPRYQFIQNTESFLPYRVLSRSEDASLQTKSMQNILPSRTQYHIILDDRRDVWANSPSWYYTREYLYFAKRLKTGGEEPDVSHYLESQEKGHPFKEKLIDYYNKMRQDYPPKKQYEVEFSEKADNFLLFAAHTLRKMHGYFFQHLKQKTQDREREKEKEKQREKQREKEGELQGQEKAGKASSRLRSKHPVHLSSIMQRLKLFLSPKKYRFFLAPDEKGVSMMNIINRAQKMGAIVLDEKSEQLPDMVIRGNNYIKYIRKHYASINQPCPEVDWPFDQNLEKLITEPPVYKLELDQQGQAKKGEVAVKGEMDVEEEPQIKINILPPPSTISPAEQFLTTKVEPPKKTEPSRDFKSQLQQLKTLARKKIPVISQTWVLACYEFSYRFRAEDFRLHDPTREEVSHEEFNDIIDRAAEKIRLGIEEEMRLEIKVNKSGSGKGQSEKQIRGFPQREREKGRAGDSKKGESPEEPQT